MDFTGNALAEVALDFAALGMDGIIIYDIANAALASDTTLTWGASGNVITEGTHPAIAVTATGTAHHFEILASGTAMFTGTCGLTAADLNFNTLALVSGDTLTLTSLTITFDNC